ncbi:hypothetical protein DBR17_13270 [Sphingomonas sp. HMWF008]|nr:hypothetical protein DBR17_13270 [Sphingomonas sp. HMWF008]
MASADERYQSEGVVAKLSRFANDKVMSSDSAASRLVMPSAGGLEAHNPQKPLVGGAGLLNENPVFGAAASKLCIVA